MVCYICGKPASFRCPVCGRYVCNEHTLSTSAIKYLNNWLKSIGVSFQNLPHYICDRCFQQATEYSNAETQARYHGTHYCDFHKCYHDDAYLANDKWESKLGIIYCGTCKKQICADSAIEGITKEIYYCSSEDSDSSYYKCSAADEAKYMYIVKTYLCPICKSLIMYKISHYEVVYKYGLFFVEKRFKLLWEGRIVPIYRYDSERHKFVLDYNYNSDCDYYDVGPKIIDIDHD